MKKKLMISIFVIAALALGGCGNSASQTAAPGKSAASSSSKLIKIAGSTSVAPLMKELRTAYEAINPDITLEIQESGSSAGISATLDGAADIGMSSRDLEAAETGGGLVATPIALDGIAVAVHPGNPIEGLTTQQIADIYKGNLSNWSQLGGNDGEIIVISREEGSGTRSAFEELLGLEESVQKDGASLKQSLVRNDSLFENSTGAVKTNVAGSKNTIGYLSLGAMDDTVRALSVDSVPCTVDTVKDGSYSIARPFLICTLGEAQGPAADLIAFILSEEGQRIVVDHNYISVAD